jgi:prephenate dehydrogenase
VYGAVSIFNSPMVVGYKGEIGRFILAGFLEHLPKANDIFCTDVNNSDEDVIERLNRADYLFLCVPLQVTRDWLVRFLPHLGGKVVVEQTSVKSFLYDDPALEGISFVSMHLLFRPSATPVQDRSGLLFSGRLTAAELGRFAQAIEKILGTPMTLIEDGVEPAHVQHDRWMARQQALVHRVILALADSLSEEAMRTFVGRRVCELADRIRDGDPILYRMIQENSHLKGELASFSDRLNAMGPS